MLSECDGTTVLVLGVLDLGICVHLCSLASVTGFTVPADQFRVVSEDAHGCMSIMSSLTRLTVLLVVVPTLRFLKSCGEPPYWPAICFLTSAATVLQTEERKVEGRR